MAVKIRFILRCILQNIELSGYPILERLHYACMEGYSVKYFRITKFLETMNAEQALGNYLKAIEKMGKIQLLILDDLGPDVMTRNQRNHFLEVIEERYMIASTIILSQLSLEQ